MGITSGSFKKGSKIRNTGRTRFKKGIIPWNKNKRGVYSKETLKIMANKKIGVKNPHTSEQNKKIGEAQKGEKGNNWKGGVTPELIKARNSLEYKIWDSAVFVNNDYTDQKTGIRGGKLHAHHIYNFSSHPELRFDINNGITLSEKSHKKFHKKYGRKNNTREQLEEFLGRKIGL